jgi:hypothetical protein
MSSHHPGQEVFRSVLPEDIDWEPFAGTAATTRGTSDPAGLSLGQPASGVTIPYSRMRR